jgi:hypothetical protein
LLDTDRFFARPIGEALKGKILQSYLMVIKHPVDFFTIENKMDLEQYASPHEAFIDLKLVFENALKFNQEGSTIHNQVRIVVESCEGISLKIMFVYIW